MTHQLLNSNSTIPLPLTVTNNFFGNSLCLFCWPGLAESAFAESELQSESCELSQHPRQADLLSPKILSLACNWHKQQHFSHHSSLPASQHSLGFMSGACSPSISDGKIISGAFSINIQSCISTAPHNQACIHVNTKPSSELANIFLSTQSPSPHSCEFCHTDIGNPLGAPDFPTGYQVHSFQQLVPFSFVVCDSHLCDQYWCLDKRNQGILKCYLWRTL